MNKRSAQLHSWLALALLCGALCVLWSPVFAAVNEQINYQGKLTNSSNVAVPDGSYDMEFSLYTQESGGSPVWTETLSGADAVAVENGLFSIMLGSTTPFTGVDFNQTLYLGVTIESDPEMSPRKVLGIVPAAFEAIHAEDADTLGGVASTSFLRSDQADTATGLLTFSNGFLSQASSSVAGLTTLTATTTNLVINGERFTDLTGTGLSNNSGVLTLNTSLLDTWYASSTDFDTYTELNALVADVTLTHNGLIDTSAELLTIVGDETGTGSLVFSASPTFTGTINAAAATLSSTLTLSGTAANIALGSNWLSGDGGDEGIFVDGDGDVGIGTTTPTSKLDVWGDAHITGTSTFDGPVMIGNGALHFFADSATPFLYASVGLSFMGEDGNTLFGVDALAGAYADDFNSVFENVAIGTLAATNLLSGSSNVAIGTNSLGTATDGTYNVGIGAGALGFASEANNSVAIGSSALSLNAGTGTIAIGHQTGDNLTSGDRNILIGYDIDAPTATSDNILNIGNLLFGTGIDGTGTALSSGNIGIGTSTPSQKLQVQGNLRVTGALYDNANSAGSNGYVLQSTGSGFNWVATSTLGINPFGASVGPTELQATDFGSFTCNGTTCTVDANSLSASMIANGDHGFFSYSSNAASLDANGLTSANLTSAVSDETGSGVLVFATSPTLTTPNLGTPSAATLTNATGLPISTGLTGAGTGVLTALGVNVGTAGSFVVNGGALGTPSSGTLTNATGLPISSGVSGLGTGVATFLATPSSANLAAAVTGETGTGALVFGTSPTFTTSALSPIFASTNADVADTGVLRLGNAESIAWEASPAGTDVTLSVTSSEVLTVNNQFEATSIRIDSSSTGVLLDTDGDGMLIIQGQGNGNDEDLRFNFDDATGGANFVDITSNTGVTTVNFSSIALQESGIAVLNADEIDASSELLALMDDETGTGSLVFSASPTFTGTVNAAAATLSSTLTLSGSAANIALGSNWLSGDGGDEGVYVTGTGNVGIGTTTPSAKLDVWGSAHVLGNVSTPTTVGNWDPNDVNVMDGAYYVTVSGNYAYVGGNISNNLAIVDISNPSAPVIVGNWDPNDANVIDGAQRVSISGNYAYIIGGTSDNLVIVDISDPTTPVIIGNWDPNDANVMDTPSSVVISGNYAYVAGSVSDNLAIIDISNPTNPVTVGNWDPNDANVMDTALSIAVSGNYAYVAGSVSDNLAIVDISNPASPVTVGNWDPNDANVMDSPQFVTVSGNYAYIPGATSDNLAIVNISDPAAPVTVGNWDPNDTNVMNYGYSVSVSGNYAYVSGLLSHNLAIVNIANPSTPVTVGNWDPNDLNVMNGAYSVAISGNYAYVSGYASDNLAIIDISGLTVSNVFAGSGLFDIFRTKQTATFDQGVNVRGGLNVGQNALINGALTIEGTASSSLLSSNNRAGLILSTGHFGIGTTTPNSMLSIQASSAGVDLFELASTSGETVVSIDGEGNFLQDGWACLGDCELYVGGGVGIGTSTPYDLFDEELVISNEFSGSSDTLIGIQNGSNRYKFGVEGDGNFTIENLAETTRFFDVTSTGDIGIGTSTPTQRLTVAGNARITGALYDNANSAGSNGYVLQSTGSGFAWVATSTLGITGGGGLTSADIDTYAELDAIVADATLTHNGLIDTSAELLAIVGDETGTGSLVFSASPTFTGTVNAAAATLSSTLTLSGTAANIALGSNFLSNDGGDEGVSVETNGDVVFTGASGDDLYLSLNEGSGYPTFFGSGDVVSFGSHAEILEGFGLSIYDSGNDRFAYLEVENNGATVLGNSAGDLAFMPAGNVGIGTTTPTSKLTIQQNSNDSLRVIRTDTGNANALFQNSTSGYTSTDGLYAGMSGSGAYLWNYENSLLQFATNNTARFTIAAAGTAAFTNSVAIGTSTPYAKLHLHEDATTAGPEIRFTNTTTGDGSGDGIEAGLDSNENGYIWNFENTDLYFATNNTQRLTVKAGGNVGIGTTTPNQALTIFRSGADAAIELSTLSGANEKWTIGIDDSDGAKFKISSSSALGTSDRLVINGAGNIGVGTASPNAKLHVYSAASGAVVNSAADELVLEGSSNTGLSILSPDASNANIYFATPADGVGAQIQWNYTSDLFTIGAHNAGADVVIQAGNGTEVMRLLDSGNVGIGTTTPNSLLGMGKTTGLTGSLTAGIDQYFNFTNSTLSAVYYGDRTWITNAPTATSTLVGKMLRIDDSTTLGNTVRGLEVQAHRGTNTQGENTALSGFARTFGVRGTTQGDAGGTYEPAGVFAETKGTTQGNAIRAYSGTITSADLLSLFQDTSAFTGTGLLMNFGNSGGSFSSSSSKFVDFQNAGTSKFTVSAHGTTTIGDGTTNYQASLQIGYGGLCVDNDGSCTASTSGLITSVSSAVGNSDLAEMYFSSENLEPGDIIATAGILSIEKANSANATNIIGVVSTKPGLTLGFDDSSLIAGQAGYPVALSGRVPIKLSTQNGPIKTGDAIMLSSVPGVGMKAREGGTVVGYALEDFDGEYAYSEGFIDQFGDDIAEPNTTPLNQETDARIHDGCSFGGGGALGEGNEDCAPKDAERFMNITSAVADRNAQMREALLDLAREDADEVELEDGTQVLVGQALMFVRLGSYQTLAQTNILNELTSTSTELVLGSGGEETLWDRVKTLAQGFIDGVLNVTGLRAENVYVENELCVDGVCVTADDLRALLQEVNRPSNGSGSGEQTPPPQEEPQEPVPPETQGGGEAGGGESNTETTPPPLEETPQEEPQVEEVPTEEPPQETEAPQQEEPQAEEVIEEPKVEPVQEPTI